MTLAGPGDNVLRAAVRRLLKESRLTTADFTLVPLPGGGNNRVYRVAHDSGSSLLKIYFRHPGDIRDRLNVEYDFTTFAWQHGVHQVPRPLGRDQDAGLGLYEFIEGRRLEPREVDDAALAQALAFYRDLNRYRQSAEAQNLPAGSEACFNLAEHLHRVERRLARCHSWQPSTELERQVATFVEKEVQPRWRQVKAQVEGQAGLIGRSTTEPLPATLRCLSPSDFGFHNALLEPAGILRFVDFEYAGWDDPAKLACDFFCQPAVPVPGRYWSGFLDDLTADLPDPARERRRMELLLPVYRMKWVTILLNDFHPAGDDRRRFARPGIDANERKAEQLAKAREFLALI
jgi:hypothetical protein